MKRIIAPETPLKPAQNGASNSEHKVVRFAETPDSRDGTTTLSRKKSAALLSSAPSSEKTITLSADDFSSDVSSDEIDNNLIPELLTKISSSREFLLHFINQLNANIESSNAKVATKSRVKKKLHHFMTEIKKVFSEIEDILSSFADLPLDNVYIKNILSRITKRIAIVAHFITYKKFESSINWISEQYKDLVILKKALTTEYIIPETAIIGKQIFDIKRALLSTLNSNNNLSLHNDSIESFFNKLHTGFMLLGELENFTPDVLKFIYDKIITLGQSIKKTDASNIQKLFDNIDSLLALMSSFLPSVDFHNLDFNLIEKQNDSESSADENEIDNESTKHSRTLLTKIGKGSPSLTALAARTERIISPREQGDESSARASSSSARESGGPNETPRSPKEKETVNLKFHIFSDARASSKSSDEKHLESEKRERKNSF